MIIRARPKYFDLKQLEGLDGFLGLYTGELYFNKARSGLKFLLENITKFKKKELTVFIQAFNCHVVIDAAIQAGCRVFVFDIKLEDLSVNIELLQETEIIPDVLILTHYQGIPNFDYVKVAKYCSENDVLLIDDMAQTEGSMVHGAKVGSLSHVQIRSYAFDKPFTSWEGGSVSIKNIESKNLKQIMVNEYSKLPCESRQKTISDLKTLAVVFISSGNIYCKSSVNCYCLINFLFWIGCSARWIFDMLQKWNSEFLLLIESMFSNLFCFWLSGNRVTKIRHEKINLIENQRRQFIYCNEEVAALECLLESEGFMLERKRNNQLCINWNRYSILDKKGDVKKRMKSRNIEVGNFNWKTSLSDSYSGHKKVKIMNDCRNSVFASKHILNIPVWSKVFRNIVKS